MRFQVVAYDGQTHEPVYNLDGDGNPTFDEVGLSYERACEVAQRADGDVAVALDACCYADTLYHEVEPLL